MKRIRIIPLIMLAVMLLSAVPAIANDNDTYISRTYVNYCEEIGAKYHVSPELLEAIIETESSGKANVNNGSCVGLMQINANVHQARMRRLGVTNLYDPYSNILVGTDLLVELYETYGDDTMMILMMYNGTSNARAKAEAGQFSQYAMKVSSRALELEKIHGKVVMY